MRARLGQDLEMSEAAAVEEAADAAGVDEEAEAAEAAEAAPEEAAEAAEASLPLSSVAGGVPEHSTQADAGGDAGGALVAAAGAAAADAPAIDAPIDALIDARLSSQRHSMTLRPGAAGGGRRDTFSGLRQQRHSMTMVNLGAASAARASVSVHSARRSSSGRARRATGRRSLPPTLSLVPTTMSGWSGLGLEGAGALLMRGLRRAPAPAPQHEYAPPSLADQLAAARWVQCAFRRWHRRHHDPAAERAVLHISISSVRRSHPTARPPLLPGPDPDPEPQTRARTRARTVALSRPLSRTLTRTLTRSVARPWHGAGLPAAQQGVPGPLRPVLPVHALWAVRQP